MSDLSYQEYVLKSMQSKVDERVDELRAVIEKADAELNDLYEQYNALTEAIADFKYRRESVGIATAPQVWH